jgi:hypothetical protein
LDRFDFADVKNDFLKIKKIIDMYFGIKKLFEKQPLPHCQALSK